MRNVLAILTISTAIFGCGAQPDAGEDADDLQPEIGETSEALEHPCTAYYGVQYLYGSDFTVCPTRGFDQQTVFRFYNSKTNGTIAVRVRSGWDEQLIMVPPQAQPTVFPWRFYGGWAKIWIAAPQNGIVGVNMY